MLAPLPTWMVGLQKIVTGLLQGLFAACLVFPIAALVPATPVHLNIHWPILLTLAPLAGWVAGCARAGAGHEGEAVPGAPAVLARSCCRSRSWAAPTSRGKTSQKVEWLKWAVLVNPLVYMTEGFRAALVGDIPHMSLWAIYGALIGFGVCSPGSASPASRSASSADGPTPNLVAPTSLSVVRATKFGEIGTSIHLP